MPDAKMVSGITHKTMRLASSWEKVRHGRIKMSAINGRKLNLIPVCLVMFWLVIAFTMFADAVKELKTSNLNGGKQYWWEAEDFDTRSLR
jgi:hypothetical protein